MQSNDAYKEENRDLLIIHLLLPFHNYIAFASVLSGPRN